MYLSCHDTDCSVNCTCLFAKCCGIDVRQYAPWASAERTAYIQQVPTALELALLLEGGIWLVATINT
jgi:hypothetical protein